MATDEKMSIDERYQYLRSMQKRYRGADRQTKKQLLDEMEIHTGMHRKSLIRRLGSEIQRQPRSRERDKEYGPEVDDALLLLWEALDYICPERITPHLLTTAELLGQHGEMALTPKLRRQLAKISISSVRRHLPTQPLPHRRRKPSAPQNRHQQAIPAYRIPRDIAEPGHLEMDLVHHCGEVTAGEYIYTLQLIDVATGWSGRRAILGRSYLVVADASHVLFQTLPFPVRELHPDNGGEFLNDHLLTFLAQSYPHIHLSCSRPGHPNDNRLVEQKNASLVRDYLGDRRLDTVTQTRFLNSLYAKMDTYYNYIQPVMKQIAKEWLPATEQRPARLKRSHDVAQPPVLRLCTYLPPEQQQPFLERRTTINPLQLRRQLYHDLDHLFAYPNAAPHEIQDVFQTLANPDLFPAARAALDAIDSRDPSPSLSLSSLSEKEVALASVT
jgi:hypothetical protein